MATIVKYNKFLLTQMNGGTDTTGGSTASPARVVDFDTDAIKVMLCTSSYTPSVTAHAVKASITNEVTGTNYAAGGTALSSITLIDTAGTIKFSAANVIWSQSNTGFANARYAVIYKDTGTPGTSTLIGYIDFTADRANTNGDIVLQWNASGIFTWA